MKACNNCGLLARRYVIGEIVEADGMYRESGKTAGLANYPTCTAMAVDLERELTGLNSNESGDGILKVIQRDRSECPQWTPWMRGFTAKEHREILLRKEEQERYAALVKGLEGRNLWLGVIGIGIFLILATLAAPALAAWVEYRFLAGG